MATKSVALVIGCMVAMLAAVSGRGGGEPGVEQEAAGYAWAAACKDCHAEIHAFWEKSKHGKAFDRLRGENKNNACVNCHITGSQGKVEEGGTLLNAGVQCESCHGGSAEHVANPMVMPPTRVPGAAVCEGCHNAKSPHFRGFVYQGMLKFGAHPVK